MIDVVFSDFDNTLAHSTNGDETRQIRNENIWIAEKSISLMREISVFVPFYIVTGRRLSSYKRVSEILPFCHGIIENGCVIVENDNIDFDYFRDFKKYVGEPGSKIGPIWDYERFLNGKGMPTDSKGRFASFRVLTDGWSDSRKEEFLNGAHPDGLVGVINQGNVDIIPPIGGKDKAICRLLQRHGTSWENSACLGDDYNDKEMLSFSGLPITHIGAVPSIREIVDLDGGYVSPFSGHRATVDMLSNLLKHVNSPTL